MPKGRKLFAQFVESNGGENWTSHIEFYKNRKELNAMKKALEPFECYCVILNELIPENEVDVLVKHSSEGYMPADIKRPGKLNFTEKMERFITEDAKLSLYFKFQNFNFSKLIKESAEDNPSFVYCFNDYHGNKPKELFVQWTGNETDLLAFKNDLETLKAESRPFESRLKFNLEEIFTEAEVDAKVNLRHWGDSKIKGRFPYLELLEKQKEDGKEEYMMQRLYKGGIDNFV